MLKKTKEVIKQVKKIEITTKNLVDGLIAGNYHSIFKGQGIEFSEIRDYRPGDDIRAIDWKVTARFNHPYVKEFIEERDLRIYFAFDMSNSGSFGNKISKKQKAIEISASLMFAALKNNDNVGAFFFTENVEKYIPARKGRKHILKIVSNLISFKPEYKKTDLKKSLEFISKIIKRRSVIFIISDFFSDDFIKPLRILRTKNDVIAINIKDNREYNMPNIGLIQLEDKESGEQILLDTSDEEFRKNYKKLIKREENNLKKKLNKNKIDTLMILTDENYEMPFKNFFRDRKHRVVR